MNNEREKAKQELHCRARARQRHKDEEVALMKTKGVKLTCPAAGRACPPSPGAGLAGLCSLPPVL